MSPTRLLKLGTLVMVSVHRVVVALCSHSHFIGHPGPPGCPTGRRSAPLSGINLPLPRHDTRRSGMCLGAVRNAGLEERHGEAIQGFESHEPSPVGVPPSCMQ